MELVQEMIVFAETWNKFDQVFKFFDVDRSEIHTLNEER